MEASFLRRTSGKQYGGPQTRENSTTFAVVPAVVANRVGGLLSTGPAMSQD